MVLSLATLTLVISPHPHHWSIDELQSKLKKLTELSNHDKDVIDSL